MSYHGRFEEKKPPKKKKKAGKIALIVAAVLLVLVIVAVIAGVMYYNSILNKVNHVEVPKIQYTNAADDLLADPDATVNATAAGTEATETEPTETTIPPHVRSSEDYINILVVGQAARVGETKDSERMADTAILCTINKYDKTLTLTSLLRDSLVRPPNYKGHEFGKIKLTTVYHLGSYYSGGDIAGSMELMNLTLYDNFGIEVDYNIEIGFDAVIKAIDVLHGVGIELTQEEADYLNAQDGWISYEVQPGLNWLDGAGALCYARMRKAEGDGDSDIKRTERQRKLINSLVAHLKEFEPSMLQDLANEVLPLISTSMTNQDITEMMMLLLPMLSDLKVETGGTCPVQSTYEGKEIDIYGDGFYHSVLTFEPAQQKRLMRAITEGES